MKKNIGIVVVSHSASVAESVALMSKEMSGGSIGVSHCGGNVDGGLGSTVDDVVAAIGEVWTEKGVAIFVDLGSTEMNSKLARKAFPKEKSEKIIIMNAPLVEGVITATSIASDGESLDGIKKLLKDMGL